MYDGVVFLDGNLQITLWNRGAERLTGHRQRRRILQRPFRAQLVCMCDEQDGKRFTDAECPVAHALQTGVQSLAATDHSRPQRPRRGRSTLTSFPSSADRRHDARRHAVAARRLAGNVARRALPARCTKRRSAIRSRKWPIAPSSTACTALFVEAHSQRGLPCSLIICDIDHFKQVNDTYGHPAGDEVITQLRAIAQESLAARGDLVARYGGEEFVMLCADCNVATAFDRGRAGPPIVRASCRSR